MITIELVIFILMLMTAVFVVLLKMNNEVVHKETHELNSKIADLRSSVRKLKYFMNLDEQSLKVIDELFAIESNTSQSLLIDRLINAYEQETALPDANVRIVKYENAYTPLIETYLQKGTKFFADDRAWIIQQVDYDIEYVQVTYVLSCDA